MTMGFMNRGLQPNGEGGSRRDPPGVSERRAPLSNTVAAVMRSRSRSARRTGMLRGALRRRYEIADTQLVLWLDRHRSDVRRKTITSRKRCAANEECDYGVANFAICAEMLSGRHGGPFRDTAGVCAHAAYPLSLSDVLLDGVGSTFRCVIVAHGYGRSPYPLRRDFVVEHGGHVLTDTFR